MITPKLTLVGAGPGDPGLITMRGVEALGHADVVLYDALANPKLLDYAPASARKIFVGKRKDDHELTQDEINKLIVEVAFKYGHVVRLKGGDPFVFGRGYEELEMAKHIGIDTEYVPGISSANAVPGLEEIPMTHRGSSESYWVITGTTAASTLSADLKLAVHSKGTVVILMGLSQLGKIVEAYHTAGRSAAPVAVIQNGSLPNRKIALGTISTIQAEVEIQGIGTPAIIVIGETVRLHPDFPKQLENESPFDYNNIFTKKLNDLKQAGNYRYFLDVNKSAQHFPKFYFEDYQGKNRSAVNWCSNDYLCMSIHEAVISRLSFVAHRSGAGSGGTRNISGTTLYHRELERTLAKLHQQEAALVFGGAYLANVTTLSTLGKLLPGCMFISDEQNHASIIEGIRISGCEKKVFRHNDVAHLREILKKLPVAQPRVVVFESVYSISGSVAPVAEIIAAAKEFNCLTYVDEVHAVGLYGKDGAGILSAEGLTHEIDIVNGTLAKGFGVVGGYIASRANIIDGIRSHGSGFIFTTSLPPAICAAASRSVGWLQEHPEVRDAYHKKIALFRSILTEHNIPFVSNESHITSIPIGDAITCKRMADVLLHEHGVYIQPVNSPTVPVGQECLRITVSIRHTENEMITLAKSLSEVLWQQPRVQHIKQEVIR